METFFNGMRNAIVDASAPHCCSLILSPLKSIWTSSTAAPSLMSWGRAANSARSASKASKDLETDVPFLQYTSVCWAACGSCEEEMPRERVCNLGESTGLGGDEEAALMVCPECSVSQLPSRLCAKMLKHCAPHADNTDFGSANTCNHGWCCCAKTAPGRGCIPQRRGPPP